MSANILIWNPNKYLWMGKKEWKFWFKNCIRKHRRHIFFPFIPIGAWQYTVYIAIHNYICMHSKTSTTTTTGTNESNEYGFECE